MHVRFALQTYVLQGPEEEEHRGVLMHPVHPCPPQLPPLHLVRTPGRELPVGEFPRCHDQRRRDRSRGLLHSHLLLVCIIEKKGKLFHTHFTISIYPYCQVCRDIHTHVFVHVLLQLTVAVTTVSVASAFSIFAIISALVFHDHHHRKVFIGSIGLVASVAMYGSPLVAVVSHRSFLDPIRK